MRRIESDAEAARRAELARFLRARRATLQPGDVDLCPRAGRRNTPGLRREEVAQISGVGVTWYTWLEQGRQITTSAHVIDALARAFRLDREAYCHLRYLADLPVPEMDQMPSDIEPELDRLLTVLEPAPACLLGPRFDFVAWNNAFARLWDPAALPPGRCNAIWLAFADPDHRRTWVNWGDRSRILLAEFRAAADHHPGDARFAELIEALAEVSSDFRLWWSRYEIRQSITGPIAVRHSGAGIIKLDVVELRVTSHPSLRLAVHVPVRALDRKKLETLSQLKPKMRAS